MPDLELVSSNGGSVRADLGAALAGLGYQPDEVRDVLRELPSDGDVDTLVKTSHLLAPFPAAMIDSAFFDRFHAYVPGWEIPKMRPEFFTDGYGLIVDYLAEWMREMRKRTFGDALNKFFKLGRDLNQRDTIAVKHTASGLLKLLYPNEEYDKEAVLRCLEYALEVRRRVKEQLKKIGGM